MSLFAACFVALLALGSLVGRELKSQGRSR